MRDSFDQRVVPQEAVELLRLLQDEIGGTLGGGAVLSGAWLRHRLSRDLDLFFDQRDDVRRALTRAPDVAASAGVDLAILRDSGTFVRCSLGWPDTRFELDLVYEPLPDLGGEGTLVEGVAVRSGTDLRASKLTCVLSRSEPRDLVDLLFLDRAGHPPEQDLSLALQKDAGIDPAILAWLLNQLPVEPMPEMLLPLSSAELLAWRDELAERMRAVSLP